MQKLAVSTQIVHPSMPALAPRAMSAACSELPKCPAMITAVAITAGKAAKIAPSLFHVYLTFLPVLLPDLRLFENPEPQFLQNFGDPVSILTFHGFPIKVSKFSI